MVDGMSPVAFKQVAGASINQAIVVRRGYELGGKPNRDIMSISLINPPDGIPDITVQMNVESNIVIAIF